MKKIEIIKQLKPYKGFLAFIGVLILFQILIVIWSFKETKAEICLRDGALPYDVTLAEPILAEKIFKYRKKDWMSLGVTQENIEKSLALTLLEPLKKYRDNDPDVIYGDSARRIRFNLDICPRQKENLGTTVNCGRDPGFADHGLHLGLSPCFEDPMEFNMNRLNYFFE